MTDRGDLALLVARANPVDDPHDLADSLDLHDSLLAAIDERCEDAAYATLVTYVDRRPAIARPAVAFASAVLALLVVVGATTLLLSGSSSSDEPADLVPATSSPESSTVSTIADAETQDEPVAVPSEPRITWETMDLRVGAPNGGVAFGEGRLVVSGSKSSLGDTVWYSDDLDTWTMAAVRNQLNSAGPPVIGALAHGPEGWVAAGSISDGRNIAFWYSEDAAEWVPGELEDPGRFGSDWNAVFGVGWGVLDIAAGGPGWVAVGHVQRDGAIWVSADGLTWSTIAPPEFAEVGFHDVSVDDDGVITVVGRPQGRQRDTAAIPGDDVVALRWTSEDGRTWTPLPFQDGLVGPETHTISVNPETGQQVALNKYGVWVSDDGTEWVETASSNGIPPYTHPSQEVVWVGDTMIGGSRDFIYESSDGGVTWVRTGPTDLEYGHARRLFSFGDTVILLARTNFWVGTRD